MLKAAMGSEDPPPPPQLEGGFLTQLPRGGDGHRGVFTAFQPAKC